MRRALNAALLATLVTTPAAPAAAAPPSCPGPTAAGLPPSRLGAAGPHLLLDANFPDPFLARHRGAYLAFATGNQVGGAQRNVQLVRSRDLVRWTAPVEALPAANLPSWVDPGHPQVWAPEMLAVSGRYVLYFNARHRSLTRVEGEGAGRRTLQRHCLGAAVADSPDGPYRGIDTPLVCEEHEEGAIDAAIFRDEGDGREGGGLYLYYKHDANCCGGGSALHVQGLSADGLAAVGPATRLLANDDSPGKEDDWEWRVVEAPTMVRRPSGYYLFYSGNFYGNRNYAVGYLKCASPRGPCADPGVNPILWSHPAMPAIGPGHQSILSVRGRDLLFFHGWNEDPDAKERPGHHRRCLYAARLTWTPAPGGGERPIVANGDPD